MDTLIRAKGATKRMLRSILFANLIILFLIAIICFMGSLLLDPIFPPNDPTKEYSLSTTLLNGIPSTLKFLAGALISVIIARFIFGLESTRAYFGDFFSDLIFETSASEILEKKGAAKLVDELSRDNRESVHYEIVKKNAVIEFPQASTFFQTLRGDIEPLLGKIHFEKLDVLIENFVKTEGDITYIESVRTITMDFHSRTSGSFDFGFKKIMQPIMGLDPNRELFHLEEFLFEGKEVRNNVVQPLLINDDGSQEYTFEYVQPYEVDIGDTTGIFFTLKRKETVLIPTYDWIVWRVPPETSLRGISITCTFDRPAYPTAWLFGIEKNPDSPQFSTYRPPEPVENMTLYKISNWEGWMLPKHGYLIKWRNI